MALRSHAGESFSAHARCPFEVRSFEPSAWGPTEQVGMQLGRASSAMPPRLLPLSSRLPTARWPAEDRLACTGSQCRTCERGTCLASSGWM